MSGNHEDDDGGEVIPFRQGDSEQEAAPPEPAGRQQPAEEPAEVIPLPARRGRALRRTGLISAALVAAL
ncbi:MAG: hypothetical protein HOW59_04795, partial [Nonomuraea sp.]|nr:hypothetical protein [Nonomuraea sp.]